MNAKILICIPVHNRLHIARECIPTVQVGMVAGDSLAIYDDGSSPHFGPWPVAPRDSYHRCDESIGIERQRKRHFFDFQAENFTHLYLTDADALHDPNWRTALLGLSEKYDDAPVCGYNTAAHERIIGNTIEDSPFVDDVIWRRVAPGISYLLTAAHVAKVVRALPMMPDHWNWDWTVPGLLGNQMLIPRTSYVDHIGLGGMHHPPDEGLDGGDRALNPTPWLVAKRAEVVAKLHASGTQNIPER